MGYRTVVMLNNDVAFQWQDDAELGRKISRAMSYASDSSRKDMACVGGYGTVVECVHADCQTLAVLDGYTMFRPIEQQQWSRGESPEDAAVRLLKQAAQKLGYRLVKKAA